ncbi:MAG: hypothetical protein KJ047_13900 [Anaerolineae bacterium]|nr:hypothetical protein [Anaerolineae bacterium]
MPAPITRPKLLVVEGTDARVFFDVLLEQMGLADTVQTQDFGGFTELPSFLRTLLGTSGFSQVISLGIVRDAENNAQSAFQSVCGSLRKAGLSVPQRPMVSASGSPSVSVFVLPDCTSPGMLETLCFQSVESDPIMPCVAEYFECVAANSSVPGNMDKPRLQAFLASRSRPGLSLRDATKAGHWPWNSPVFDPLKQFLRAL